MTLPCWFYLWKRVTAQHYLLAMSTWAHFWGGLCQCLGGYHKLSRLSGRLPTSLWEHWQAAYSVMPELITGLSVENQQPLKNLRKLRTGWD
jgi:hypothetical protein